MTAAIAIEEGIANEDSLYSDSPFELLGETIYCYSGEEGHGDETLKDALIRSCNPVFSRIALEIGMDTFYSYMNAFGFMEPTGVGLPGETSGIFHAEPSNLDLAVLAFGESSTVTPLQTVRAFSALVNGGKLLKPRIVRSLTDQSGQVVKEYPVEVVRQVLSEETSARMRSLLGSVFTDMHRAPTAIGYAAGGKTSTSTDEITGENTYSFVEIAPIDQPRIVTLIILEKPPESRIASTDVAEIVNRVTSRVLTYIGENRDYTGDDIYSLVYQVPVPDLKGLTYQQASEQLLHVGLLARPGTDDMLPTTIIRSSVPEDGFALYRNGVVYLYPDKKSTGVACWCTGFHWKDIPRVPQ